jgi:hypothetical protein
MPSFEKTNHHFQHGQADINVGLRGAEITSHIRLMQPQLASFDVHIFPTQTNDFARP